MIKKMNTRNFVYYLHSYSGVSIRWDKKRTFDIGTLTIANAEIDFMPDDQWVVSTSEAFLTDDDQPMSEEDANVKVSFYFDLIGWRLDRPSNHNQIV